MMDQKGRIEDRQQERLEDILVVEALRSVGVNVVSSQDLMRARGSYSAAIPVLIEMLGRVRTYTLKEILVRSLGTKEAKGKAEQVLIAELESSLGDDSADAKAFRWAVANTLEIIGGKGDVDAFMRLLRDPRSSNARGMLILAAKTRDRRIIPMLLEFLDVQELQGFAAGGLGMLGAAEANHKLEAIVNETKNSWVRREASKALARISKALGTCPGGKVSKVPPTTVSLEEQLRALAECGISLSASVAPDLLARSVSRERYEKEPYILLLCAMGEEAETDSQAEHKSFLSDNIWHFDTECIEGHGAYVAIAKRMAVLAQGDLPLEGVQDCVDVEGGEASLSFVLDGQSYKWQAKIDDDWVDPQIISHLVALLASRETERRFTYIDLDGQDCLIGCATAEQQARLQNRTGLKVERMIR
jgi:hypothetical protein